MVSLSSISSWFQRALVAFALGQTPARHAKPRSSDEESSLRRETEGSRQEQEWCEHLWLLPPSPYDEPYPYHCKCVLWSRSYARHYEGKTFPWTKQPARTQHQRQSSALDRSASSASSITCCPLCQLPIRPMPTSQVHATNSPDKSSECVHGPGGWQEFGRGASCFT